VLVLDALQGADGGQQIAGLGLLADGEEGDGRNRLGAVGRVDGLGRRGFLRRRLGLEDRGAGSVKGQQRLLAGGPYAGGV
jgi:hypothetical protein